MTFPTYENPVAIGPPVLHPSPSASVCTVRLFTDEPLPEGGFIDLPDRPGFGVTLNREKLVETALDKALLPHVGEPRPVRRLVSQVSLEPSDTP